MAYQSLGLGSAADDGTGDSLRVGGDKINDNFVEIYTALGSGTALCSGITAGADDFTFVGTSYNAVWDKSDNALEFADNAKAIFGTSADLSIYHDGSNSYVSDQGTGLLVMLSNNFRVNNAANSEVMFNAVEDGAVSIYYDNTVHLATDAAGVNITGTLDLSSHLDMPDSAYIKLGTSDDLQIYHDGSNSYINDSGTGNLKILGSQIDLLGGTDGAETMATFVDNGAVSLYYDDSAKIATSSAGVSVTGTVTATPTAILLVKNSSGTTLKTINGIAAT